MCCFSSIIINLISSRSNDSVGTIVVNQRGLEVQLFVDSTFDSGMAVLRLVVTNNNPVPIEKFHFQAAVTKVSNQIVYGYIGYLDISN